MNENKKLRLLKEFKEMVDNKEFFAKPGEEFNGNKGCIIWTSAEEWAFKEVVEGIECKYPLADYYDKMEGYKRFNDWLNKKGLTWEWYDPGTIMIYEEVA